MKEEIKFKKLKNIIKRHEDFIVAIVAVLVIIWVCLTVIVMFQCIY